MAYDLPNRARSYRRRTVRNRWDGYPIECFYPVIVSMTDEQPTRDNPVVMRTVLCSSIAQFESPMSAVYASDDLLRYYNEWRF